MFYLLFWLSGVFFKKKKNYMRETQKLFYCCLNHSPPVVYEEDAVVGVAEAEAPHHLHPELAWRLERQQKERRLETTWDSKKKVKFLRF